MPNQGGTPVIDPGTQIGQPSYLISLTQYPNGGVFPVSNPVRYAFQFLHPQFVFIRLTVKLFNIENFTDNLLTILDIYSTPTEPNIARVDLSSILQDYVTTRYHNEDADVVRLSENITGLNLIAVPFIVNAAGAVVEYNTSYSGFSGVVFNGKLDRVRFAEYNYLDVILNTTQHCRFMTTKVPTINTHVNQFSKEYLYYFQMQPRTYIALKITGKNKDGSTLNVFKNFGTDTALNRAGIIRIDASPSNLFTPLQMLNLKYYSIQLVQSNAANTVSDIFTDPYQYTYDDVCNQPIYLHWVNQFGVYETSEFILSDATLNAERTTAMFNTNALVAGIQQDYTTSNNAKFFNSLEKNINVSSNYNLKLTTRPLSDFEVNYLQDLILSKRVLLEHKGNFIPVIISDTSYNTTPKAQLTDLNIKTFNVKIADDFRI